MTALWQPYVSFWRQHRLTLLIVVAIAGLSVGGLYARGQPLDLQLFRTINTGLTTAGFDLLGDVGYVLGTVGFSLLLFVALFFLGYRPLAASAVGAVVAAALLVLLLKSLTQQPRPAQLLQGVRLIGVPELGSGFPSGHGAQAFLTAYLLASYFLFPWYDQLGLYALAGAIALSRVYVGLHFPVDVLTGSLIGLLFGVLWTHSRLWPGAQPREGRRR